jgi:hypothetical protein
MGLFKGRALSFGCRAKKETTVGRGQFAVIKRRGLVGAAVVALIMPAVVVASEQAAQATGSSVSNLVVHPEPAAPGWQDATYTVTFTATHGISSANTLDADQAAILVQSDNGTVFGGGGMTVTDNTNPADSPGDRVCTEISRPSSIGILGGCYSTSLNIPVGDSVTLSFNEVKNPPTSSTADTLSVSTNNDPNPVASAAYAIEPEGYWLVGSDGGIFSFGSANFYGSTGSLRLQRPVVGIVTTADHGGYWLDASDGGVFSFGDTSFYGSIPGLGVSPAGTGGARSLRAPIVGMVPSADDHGYFMVASDGGVFAFGDATFAGSCYSIGGCSGSAVSVMPDASGHGYWLVTTTGAVYGFGDASFLGAPGNTGAPVTAAVRTPDGKGYWILDAAGNVHGYGDAADLGNVSTNGAFDGITAAIWTDSFGDGYGVSSLDGAVKTFGGVPYDGDMWGTNLNGSIIAASGF